MEKNLDLNEQGNDYTTLFRQYDARIGRWKSVDPKPSATVSSYVSFGNNPNIYTDILGDTIFDSYVNLDFMSPKNIAIIHISKADKTKEKGSLHKTWDGNALKESGWSYIVTDDIRDAEKFIKDNFTEGVIQSAAIRIHGSGVETQKCNNGMCTVDNKSAIFHTTSKGTVTTTTAAEIISNKFTRKTEESVINSLSKILNYFSPDVTVAFAACGCGVNQRFVYEENNTLNNEQSTSLNYNMGYALWSLTGKKNATIYFSTNASSMYQALKKGGGNITLSKNFEDKNGWLKTTLKGTKVTGNNLKITIKGFKETYSPFKIEEIKKLKIKLRSRKP